MAWSYAIPSALEYFAALVHSDEQLPLLEAVACLAQDEYPELDVQQLLADVDQLQLRLRRRLPADAGALQRLQLLNHFFYDELGFGGNSNDYYDPDNSYLHAVLRTRRGIPVSLAVLWLELAQAIELPVRGVAFPGHFLVKVLLPQGQVLLDPLTGQSLSRQALLGQLEPFLRRHGWQGEEDMLPLELYLQPAGRRDILARMLRNLKEIHQAQRDDARLLAVLDRLIVLQPQAWDEWRDRGLVHAECGHYPQAVADLENYLAHVPQGPEVQALVQRLGALKAP
jgi:regulator of sirC expression with transglutaminase-like and TPR domain